MKIVVSPLGEVIRDGNLVAGSLDLSREAKRLPKKEQIRWQNGDRQIEEKITRLATRRFDRDLKKKLGERLYEHVQKIYRAQNVNNGRFRVYGGVNPKKGEWVNLVTEFIWWSNDKKFWNDLEALAQRIGAEVVTLHEGPHLDKTSHDDGKTWITGPNHGRKERQVEFAFDVREYSTPRLKKKMEEVARKTKELWEKAGVAVI